MDISAKINFFVNTNYIFIIMTLFYIFSVITIFIINFFIIKFLLLILLLKGDNKYNIYFNQ